MITEYNHVGTDVSNGQFAVVIIPGHDPIPTIVMGTNNSKVLMMGSEQTSWVDSEFVYERNKV
jgi:hypothetical protein